MAAVDPPAVASRSWRQRRSPRGPLPAVVEAVADVLGATEWPGLSGDQIGQLLAQVRIDDPYPSITKRKRLAAALQNRQAQDGHSNRW